MEIKRISNGVYTAEVNLSRGANCISLKHKKSSALILREPPKNYELDNPYLYGMPILFPVNRIEGAEFEFEGRRYVFPLNEPRTNCHLHGMLHEAQFELTRLTDTSIEASYVAGHGEYIGFPHKFEIRIKYEISDAGFEKTVTVINDSDENMPCLLGFHTTFNARPFGNDVKTQVAVDIEREYERNMQNYLPTGVCPEPDEVTKALKKGEFDPLSKPISRHYLAGGNMQMRIASEKFTMLYENSANMPFRLIYNGNADEFICLEPQTSLANSPSSPFTREDAGFTYIAPHSKKVFTSKIKITEE